MAEYQSEYTGPQIDAAIAKANTATQPEDLGDLATKDTVNYETEVTNKPTIPAEVTEQTVAGWGFTKNTGDYSKPAGGIPATDLTQAVQTILEKANATNLSTYEFNETDLGPTVLNYIATNNPDLLKVTTQEGNVQDYYKGTDRQYYCLIGEYLMVLTIEGSEGSYNLDVKSYNFDDIKEVSGTDDGTNWTSITIDGKTRNIPEGGGGGGTTVVANPTLEGNEAHLDGLQVGSTKYSTRPDLSGKVISIMGDSISTYAGWIPNSAGVNDGTGTLMHAIYYPNYGSYVNNVNMTWWHKLIFDKFKAKLGVNESWSGSFVGNNKDTNTATTTSCHAPGNDTGPDTCMAGNTRILRLGANGTPDIIYVYGGTNDIAQPGTPGESLGTFNSATDYSTVDTSTVKWTYFVDAYRTMIQRMQYYYPKAKIIALLPTYCHSYYNRATLDSWVEQIKLICDYFGVNYIDLRACGITWANSATSRNAKGVQTLGDNNIHPNDLGHTMIADYVEAETYKILQQDGAENIVYSITNDLSTLTNTSPVTGVSAGESYTATLTGSDLTVGRVYMGGTDITSTAYNDTTGVITIASVTGDITLNEGAPIAVPVTGVSLNAQTKSISPNDVETLTATIAPANATNKVVTWSVDNNHVTIVPNGLTCTVTGVSNGTSVVTVTTDDGSFTASCTFTVHQIALNSIAITTPPSTTAYHYGDTFSKVGMVVTAYYDDSTSEVLEDSEYTVTPSGALTDSDTSVTISYTYNGVTKTATQNITVATLSSIAVTTQPAKTTYVVGEFFDPTGMIVTATWSDNTTSTVLGYTYSPSGALTTSDTAITISYTYDGVTQSTTQTITINQAPQAYYHTDNATSAVLNAEAKPNYASFVNYADKTYFEGKTILAVRLKPYTAGTLTVGLVNVANWTSASSKTNITQLTLQQSDVGVVTEYPFNVYCPVGYAPFVMVETDTGTFYYKENGQGQNGFNNSIARGKNVGLSNACNLGVDFGIAQTTTWYSSNYNANTLNASARPIYAGFAYSSGTHDSDGLQMNRVRFVLDTAGTFTVGKCSSDYKTITDSEQITITGSAGDVIEAPLSKTYTLQNGEHFFISQSSDTGIFKYTNRSVPATQGDRSFMVKVGTANPAINSTTQADIMKECIAVDFGLTQVS